MFPQLYNTCNNFLVCGGGVGGGSGGGGGVKISILVSLIRNQE